VKTKLYVSLGEKENKGAFPQETYLQHCGLQRFTVNSDQLLSDKENPQQKKPFNTLSRGAARRLCIFSLNSATACSYIKEKELLKVVVIESTRMYPTNKGKRSIMYVRVDLIAAKV